MEDIPFLDVATLVSEIEDRVIPLAIRQRWTMRKQTPLWLSERLPRFFEWMRLHLDGERMLLAWLHERAGMRSWHCLAFAFQELRHFLYDAANDDPEARRLAGELLVCQTTWNVVWVAMRFARDRVQNESSESG